MCGIAGEIDYQGQRILEGRVYDAMGDSLVPRGPDQQGIVQAGAATLIHTRLAVVDLEGGRQPMEGQYRGEDYCLVYNGELYNTQELRRELESCGHSFQGHSDTELVLHSFFQWGEGCLARFQGIYAFAIWKKQEEKLFFARDRMGVKPLFYALEEGVFLFASEIKALLRHPSVRPKVEKKALAQMILLGPGREMGNCVFSQIQEVKPAHCGWYSRGGLSLRPYWSLVDRPYHLGLSDTLAHLRELVEDAVTRQISCDVPLGTFLSGGLDSSILTALTARRFQEEGRQLDTFSVDYVDNGHYYQETHFQKERDDHYIQQMSQAFSTRHHQILLDTPQLIQALFQAVEARDLPGMADVDSSLLLFCRQVKERVTVVLSGECADELFGGYPWFRDPDIRDQSGFPWAQNSGYRASFLQPELANALTGPAESWIQGLAQATADSCHILNPQNPVDRRMKEMTRLNTDWFMQTLLERKDRMSMACGLEVRVPFCDHRIAELLYCLPWELKEYQGQEKGILRKAMEGLLPEEVLWRTKSPYPKTMNPNYYQGVCQLLQQVLDQPHSPLHQVVSAPALRQLMEGENPQPWYGQLMTAPQTVAYFLQLNHWLSKYQVEIV